MKSTDLEFKYRHWPPDHPLFALVLILIAGMFIVFPFALNGIEFSNLADYKSYLLPTMGGTLLLSISWFLIMIFLIIVDKAKKQPSIPSVNVAYRPFYYGFKYIIHSGIFLLIVISGIYHIYLFTGFNKILVYIFLFLATINIGLILKNLKTELKEYYGNFKKISSGLNQRAVPLSMSIYFILRFLLKTDVITVNSPLNLIFLLLHISISWIFIKLVVLNLARSYINFFLMYKRK